MNNTILRTYCYDGISFSDNSNAIIIINNILAYNREEGIETYNYHPAYFTHDYNCFWQNGKEPIKDHTPGANSIIADPLFIDLENHNYFLQSNSPCLGTGQDGLNIGALGISTAVATDHNMEIPTNFKLKQNYPNPFNPETHITYQLPEDSHVELKIYNTLGQEITTLLNEDKPAGYYTVLWDGRNNNGKQVVSGIYLYKIKAGDFVCTKKMILLR